MSTDRRTTGPDVSRTRWFLPAFCVFLGVVMLAASAIGHHPDTGLYGLGVMVVFGAVVYFGGRSETIRGLRGDGRDERFAMIDLQATAFAGGVLIVAVIVAFLYEVAHGRSGRPFDLLGAIAGIAYVVGVVQARLRG